MVKHIKLYQEPSYNEEGKYVKNTLNEDQIKSKLEESLKEGVLKTNCGVPIVIIVNKSDVVTQSGEKKKYEENSDFILKHIRKQAIEYGATIIYTSGKTSCNLPILYDYLCHTLFNFDLKHKPNLIDKEAYFVPSGYDNLTLLTSNDLQGCLDFIYKERIPPEKARTVLVEEEVICEDTYTFLAKLKGENIISKEKSKPQIGMRNQLMDLKMKEQLEDSYRTNIPVSKESQADKMKKFMERKREEKKEEQKTNEQAPSISSGLSKESEDKKAKDAKYQKTKEEMLKKLGLFNKKKK